ncbi:extracellular solute-binding protein [Paenibacillus chungangensis]|uniref:Extracellular solute-binding protein n=1 Tax=Paenibacillus chungangensis TaxID=696535 RepID=A0ABW3HQB3_9BACL
MLRRKDDFARRYEKFKNDLRGEIVSGTIKPNEFILPENTLSERYQLSRVSVRKVLAELVEEGLIEKISGKGNRVTVPAKGLESKETIKLSWFSTSYEIDIVREIIQQYERSQPFANIDLTIIPESGYVETLTQLIENDDGPDVFMISDSQFREWVDMEKTHLFHPYLSADMHPETDSYPSVFNLFEHEGQAIITPFLFSPVVICYNENLIDPASVHEKQAFANWDTLLETAKMSTIYSEDDERINHYGFCFSSSPHRWPVFMLQNEGTLLSDNEESNRGNANTIESLQFCLDLMYKEHVSPIYSHGSEFLAESLFAKERVAMILSTYYFMNEFRGSSIPWNVRLLPKQKTEGTLLLGGGLALNKKSPRRKLAQSFIDYMVSAEAQTLLKKRGCTIPARKEIAENDKLLNPQIHPRDYNIFKEMMPYAVPLLKLGLSHSEINMMRNELQLMWMNMESPRDACPRIARLIHEQRAAGRYAKTRG